MISATIFGHLLRRGYAIADLRSPVRVETFGQCPCGVGRRAVSSLFVPSKYLALHGRTVSHRLALHLAQN